jgi:transcription initiation factor IIE alpha subunit
MEREYGFEIHFGPLLGPQAVFFTRIPRRGGRAKMTQGEVEGGESLFTAPEIQRVLIKMYEGDNVEFKASIDRNGTITYHELEALARVDSIWAKQILDFLESEGILVKEPTQSFFACSNCDSKDLAFRVRCPACKGEAFKIGSALEHLNCGHADLEDAFISANGFRCPNCKKGLKTLGLDYRRFNHYYKCINCARLSGLVDELLLCNRCGRKMSLDETRHGMLSSYRYNPESRAKIEHRLLTFTQLREKLASHRYASKFAAHAVGKSGVRHRFDIIAWPTDEPQGEQHPSIIVDIFLGNPEALEGQIAAAVAKSMDVGSKHAFLAVVPQATPEWIKNASSYGVTIVECPSMSAVSSRLEAAVMAAIAPASTKPQAPSPTEQKPEPSPSQPTGVKGEDAVILSAISAKQDELNKLIQWYIVKSKLLENQTGATRHTNEELSR